MLTVTFHEVAVLTTWHFFFFNNSLLPQENEKIRNGVGTCRSGRALIFLQEASETNENVLSWFISPSHQTLAGLDSENSWTFPSTPFTGGPQLCMKDVTPTKARGTELAAREDSELLKMATVLLQLSSFPRLPEILLLHRLKIENCRNNT